MSHLRYASRPTSIGRLTLNSIGKQILVLLFATVLAGLIALPAIAQSAKAVRLSAPNSSYTTASGINTVGDVVGVFEHPGQQLQGFAYVAATKKYKLISYPGALYTTALGVNDSNTIVGTFAGSDGVTHG